MTKSLDEGWQRNLDLMRVWVAAAAICSTLLAIGTTLVLLSGSNSESVSEGPYANLWVMPLPPAKLALAPYPVAAETLLFCPHPELEIGPGCSLQLTDSAIYDVLGSDAWPAPTPSTDCAAPGWVLKVNFLDRTHLTYGPCTHPSSIIQLREWLLEHFASPWRLVALGMTRDGLMPP